MLKPKPKKLKNTFGYLYIRGQIIWDYILDSKRIVVDLMVPGAFWLKNKCSIFFSDLKNLYFYTLPYMNILIKINDNFLAILADKYGVVQFNFNGLGGI